MSDWDEEPVCSRKVKVWTILGVVVVLIGILIAVLVSSIHKINEGHVGVYFRHGALQPDITNPGMHMMAPFVTEVKIQKKHQKKVSTCLQ